jgi:hypothetical protein
MCSDLGSGSRCCALYSATGIIFTVSETKRFWGIGVLLRLSTAGWILSWQLPGEGFVTLIL